VVLFCATVVAQPVIKVPPTCEVVVAGSGVGAVTGFGGQVGNGGVVSMPDPYPANTFSYTPNGTTVTSWSLLGDLSIITGTASGSPVASAGAVTSLKIQSYNKFLRPSENGTPSLARSKGRVTVFYGTDVRRSSITFEIFKNYTAPLPTSIGQTCLLPNTQYTFSADQTASDNANDAIGFDSYYWSGIPANVAVSYFSADFSSITFTTGNSVPATSTLECCYGRVNPTWDGGVSNFFGGAAHGTCVTFLLKRAATAPLFTSTTLTGGTIVATPGTNCLPTSLPAGQASFSVTYPTPPTGTTYVWSIVSGVGWNLATDLNSPVIGQTRVTVSGIDNNPGTLKLTVNNGCTPVDFIYQISRSFVAPSMAISPASACLLAGSTTTFSTNGLGNGTNWQLSPSITGATITPSTVGSTMSLFIPTTAAIGTYTLTANGNTSGTYTTCGGLVTTLILLRPTAPSIPVGATCVVRNGGPALTYTTSAVPGATGYQWSFPSGWVTGNTVTPLPTVTITPNGNTASGTIGVVALGVTNSGCNSASSPLLAINYSVLAPAITEKPNCYNVNMASAVTVNVTNAPNPFFGTYTVSLTQNGTTTPNYAVASSVAFNSSVSPNTISFNTIDTIAGIVSGTGLVSPPPGLYNLTITFDTQTVGSTCASTASTTIQITIPPANAASLLTNYAPATNGTDNYIVINAPTGSTYNWRIGNNIILGANNNSIGLIGNAGLPGRVSVDVTPPPATLGECSSITRLISPAGATHGLRQITPIKKGKTLAGIVVYPNPSTGDFTIDLETVKQAANAVLFDINGKEIAVYLLKKGENKIENEGLAKGNYVLSINIDGQYSTKKIIIK